MKDVEFLSKRMKLLFCCLLLSRAAAAFYYPSWEEEEIRIVRNTTCNCGWTNRGRFVRDTLVPVLVRRWGTTKNEFPLMASLQDSRRHFCSGTIITKWHVLTAAHCTRRRNPAQLTIVLGLTDINGIPGLSRERYNVSRIISHESYNSETLSNDISIILTQMPISFHQNVGPACLPTQRLNLVGEKLLSLGWTPSSYREKGPKLLREVSVQVQRPSVCRTGMEEFGGGSGYTLCTAQVDPHACQLDYGAQNVWFDPEINKYTVVAMTTYPTDCQKTEPSVNTDVSAYVSWIKKIVTGTRLYENVCVKI